MSKRELSDVPAAAPEAVVDAASIVSLAGKVVLVTGASSGIGRAMAIACAEAGADVAISYNTNERGAADVANAIQAAGRRSHITRVNAADPDDVQRLARDVAAAFGRVDAWINNAGADILTGRIKTASRLEKLDLLLAVDLRGTMLASWAAVDLMQHVLGPRALERNEGRIRAAVRGGEGRDLLVQPGTRALRGAADPRERARPRLDRDGLREWARSRREAADHRSHPPRSVGHPGGRRARCRVPRLGRGWVRHRPDVVDQRRERGLVPPQGDRMAAKEPTYSDADIEAKLKDFPGWWYEDGWIRRTYKTDGWPTTLMLVNAIGYIAEAAYHHPDLSVTWGRVIVKLQNHAAGGITDKDFELARKIEESVLWRPKGGALEGTPNKFVRSGDPR
ncbi:MAG: 4a-hydroxytetrahydrobiopterin dehydratase [Gemmatimonadetes bacterium]|nr:MAG: 4a-hydroxytetrahydrobiopterin dehydratase [Gemmatimonadota bacterium]